MEGKEYFGAYCSKNGKMYVCNDVFRRNNEGYDRFKEMIDNLLPAPYDHQKHYFFGQVRIGADFGEIATVVKLQCNITGHIKIKVDATDIVFVELSLFNCFLDGRDSKSPRELMLTDLDGYSMEDLEEYDAGVFKTPHGKKYTKEKCLKTPAERDHGYCECEGAGFRFKLVK